MKFNEVLNNYISILNSSSKEVAIKSNISESVISRYRRGKRKPKVNGKQLNDLINGLYEISVSKNMSIKKEEIEKNINDSLNEEDFNYETFSKNLNLLIKALNININDMSKYIMFDSSYISRIRYNKSKPSNPSELANKITNYVMSKYSNNLDILNSLIKDELNVDNMYNKLFYWLTSNQDYGEENISNFLNKLDSFDLNNYIKSIKFDELKVPSIPFYRAKSKTYYGIEEMKKGELDFFKGTVLTKNNKVFMCSDMPMEDMAKDIEFGKKWMFGIACMLKKGIHLNIIHNLDRPFNEMMLGLESWIPIYMTGQVTPYYFKDIKTNIYQNLTYVSNNLALAGESINGYHNKGKYYLTNNKKEVAYYQEKSQSLLKKASPLMNIYKKDTADLYNDFLKDYYKINEPRTRYLSSLPLFTISNNLLTSILKRNNINKNDITKIINYKNNLTLTYNSILNSSPIGDNIHIFSKEEFKNTKPNLLLSDIFYEKRINYTYEEYLQHLDETIEFSKKNKNYKLNKLETSTFKNITVTILSKQLVIISKEENPTIHFIIKHPKLINAISNFNPLVKE